MLCQEQRSWIPEKTFLGAQEILEFGVLHFCLLLCTCELHNRECRSNTPNRDLRKKQRPFFPCPEEFTLGQPEAKLSTVSTNPRWKQM